MDSQEQNQINPPPADDDPTKSKPTEDIIEIDSSNKSNSKEDSDQNGKSETKNDEPEAIADVDIEPRRKQSKESSSSLEKVEQILPPEPFTPTKLSDNSFAKLPVSPQSPPPEFIEGLPPGSHQIKQQEINLSSDGAFSIEAVENAPNSAADFQNIEEAAQQARPDQVVITKSDEEIGKDNIIVPDTPNIQLTQTNENIPESRPIQTIQKPIPAPNPSEFRSNISEQLTSNPHTSQKTNDSGKTDESRQVSGRLSLEDAKPNPISANTTEVLSIHPNTQFSINEPEQEHHEDDKVSIRLSDLDKEALQKHRHTAATRPREQPVHEGSWCSCVII